MANLVNEQDSDKESNKNSEIDTTAMQFYRTLSLS